MFLSVQMHQPERTAHAYMDALQAFWPGLQVSLKHVILVLKMLQMDNTGNSFNT